MITPRMRMTIFILLWVQGMFLSIAIMLIFSSVFFPVSVLPAVYGWYGTKYIGRFCFGVDPW